MILSDQEVTTLGFLYEGMSEIYRDTVKFENFIKARLAGQDRENRVRLDRVPMIIRYQIDRVNYGLECLTQFQN